MKKIIEWCPHCEQEVKLEAIKFKAQECPNCKALIKACSLCDPDKCKCKECGKMPTIECGKTLEEYMEKFGEAYNNGELWDFSAEDVNGRQIDLDPEQVYWEIDGRIYETKVL